MAREEREKNSQKMKFSIRNELQYYGYICVQPFILYMCELYKDTRSWELKGAVCERKKLFVRRFLHAPSKTRIHFILGFCNSFLASFAFVKFIP